MNLTKLVLQNFRRFDSFEMSFNEDLTVIAARNGQGKTTVLEAVVSALGPFVGAFDYGKSKHIEKTDAHFSLRGSDFQTVSQYPVTITAQIKDPDIQWQRSLNGPKSRTTIKEAEPLASWGRSLQKKVRSQEVVLLPVIRYYSSRRLWANHYNVSTKSILTESRTAGYEDCLSVYSSYSQLQEWMKESTFATLQARQQSGYERSTLALQIQGVSAAVENVLTEEGWTGFHYSLVFKELAMSHPDHGALPLSMLSDGVRAMISLVADLALRCARLNSHKGENASLETPGIVLIDEVDLHLHPAWQQRVILALRKAFPRVQFIVSTHSPQVLSTVEREHIRTVYQNTEGGWCSSIPSEEIIGIESGVALNDVMKVNPVPPVEQAQWIVNYTNKIEDGTFDDSLGKELRGKLLEFYGPDHSVLRAADSLIRFQAFKLRKQLNSDSKE